MAFRRPSLLFPPSSILPHPSSFCVYDPLPGRRGVATTSKPFLRSRGHHRHRRKKAFHNDFYATDDDDRGGGHHLVVYAAISFVLGPVTVVTHHIFSLPLPSFAGRRREKQGRGGEEALHKASSHSPPLPARLLSLHEQTGSITTAAAANGPSSIRPPKGAIFRGSRLKGWRPEKDRERLRKADKAIVSAKRKVVVT